MDYWICGEKTTAMLTPVDEATFEEDESITFSWYEVSNHGENVLFSYRLQIASDPVFLDLLYNSPLGSTTSHTESYGYSAGTYYWRVGVYVEFSGSGCPCSDGGWYYGGHREFTVIPPCPDFSDFNISDSDTCGYIRVTWDTYDDCTYELDRDPGGSGWPITSYSELSDGEYEDGGSSIDEDVEYEYAIYIHAPTGCTDMDWEWSSGEYADFNYDPDYINCTTLSENSIQLNWDDREWPNDYLLYRNTTNTPPATSFATVGGDPYIDAGLDPSTRYYYWVRYDSECGLSAYSPSCNCETMGACFPPTNVTATRYDCDSVDIIWSAADDAISYMVIRGISSTFSAASDTIAPGITDTFYSDNSAPVGDNAWYWVLTVCSEDTSAEGANDSASIFPLPGDITSIAAEADTLLNDRIYLNWTSSTNTEYYRIYRAPETDSSYEPIDSVDIPDTHYVDIGLYANEDYYYCIVPINICGVDGEATSDTVGDTTFCATPAIPVLSGIGYPDSVVITWSSIPCDDYVLIRAFFGSSDYDTVYEGSLLAHTDTDVIADSTYNYKVCAVSTECGTGEFCDPFMVHVPIDEITPPDWVTLEFSDDIPLFFWVLSKFRLEWDFDVTGADGYLYSTSKQRGNFIDQGTPVNNTPLEDHPYYPHERLNPGDPYYAYVRSFMEYGAWGDTMISITTDTAAACRRVDGHNIAIPKLPPNDAGFYENEPAPTFEWYKSADGGVTNYRIIGYDTDEALVHFNSGLLPPTDSSWTMGVSDWEGLYNTEYEWTIETCYGALGCFGPYTKPTFSKVDSTRAYFGGDVGGTPIDTSEAPEMEMDLYSEDDSRMRPTSFATTLLNPNGSYSFAFDLPPLPPFPPSHHRAVVKPDYSMCNYTDFPTFTASDAMLTKRYVNGNLQFDQVREKLADVDDNGTVNSSDVIQINCRAQNMPPLSFTAGEWFYMPESISVRIDSAVIIADNDFFAGLYGDIDNSCYWGTSVPEMPETDDASEAILVIDNFSGCIGDTVQDSIIVKDILDTDSTYMPDSLGSFTVHLTYDPSVMEIITFYADGPFTTWNGGPAWVPSGGGTASLACYADTPIPTPSTAVLVRFSFRILSAPTDTTWLRLPYWEITDFEGIPAFGYTQCGISDPPLGIGEDKVQLPEISEVNIVPNPFNASFIVTFISTANTNLEVLDITGRQLYKETVKNDYGQPTKVTWNSSDHISDVASGIYFVRITSDKMEIKKKVTCIK